MKAVPENSVPVKAKCPECGAGLMVKDDLAYCPTESCTVDHLGYRGLMGLNR